MIQSSTQDMYNTFGKVMKYRQVNWAVWWWKKSV